MDYFGASVAGIGDVDGDGMEDMVVGALGDDEAALNAGPCWGVICVCMYMCACKMFYAYISLPF